MKWGISILPKPEVLDSKGRAVLQSLQQEGFKIQNCQMGKYIILDLKEENKEASYLQAKKIAKDILHNPLIENFTIEILDDKK